MKDNNNKVRIMGRIEKQFEFNHTTFGENFYKSILSVNRQSDAVDYIPIMISDRLIDIDSLKIGTYVDINAEYRTRNYKGEDNKMHVETNIFVKNLVILADNVTCTYINNIEIIGYICSEPKYRETPLGREITDLKIAVNRGYGNSDYINGIVWGRNAKFAEKLAVGTKVKAVGRIQSREYIKKISEDESIKKTAYEVSISRLEVLAEDNE